MPLCVLAIIFVLLVIAASIRARAQTKKIRRTHTNRPKSTLSASGFPDDVFGSQELARKRREDLDKHRLFEEAKRQRRAIAEAKRIRSCVEQRVRHYRCWWMKAVLASLIACAAFGLGWGFLDARGLVPQPIRHLLALFSR